MFCKESGYWTWILFLAFYPETKPNNEYQGPEVPYLLLSKSVML